MGNRFPGQTCVFCPNPSVGVGEHVWPSWFISEFHGQGPFTTSRAGGPVNDYIAGFFAVVFHSERLSGSSVWEAFVKAREAARTGTWSSSPEDIERLWPTWSVDVSAAISRHPHDWLSYRLSGRHWG